MNKVYFRWQRDTKFEHHLFVAMDFAFYASIGVENYRSGYHLDPEASENNIPISVPLSKIIGNCCENSGKIQTGDRDWLKNYTRFSYFCELYSFYRKRLPYELFLEVDKVIPPTSPHPFVFCYEPSENIYKPDVRGYAFWHSPFFVAKNHQDWDLLRSFKRKKLSYYLMKLNYERPSIIKAYCFFPSFVIQDVEMSFDKYPSITLYVPTVNFDYINAKMRQIQIAAEEEVGYLLDMISSDERQPLLF